MRTLDLIERIEATLKREEFWRGAIAARTEMYHTQVIPTMSQALHHHTAIDNLEFLELSARYGYNIIELAEYRKWRNLPKQPSNTLIV